MENKQCPNCGRNLTENEKYCYFCDFELENFSGESDKIFPKARHKKKS